MSTCAKQEVGMTQSRRTKELSMHAAVQNYVAAHPVAELPWMDRTGVGDRRAVCFNAPTENGFPGCPGRQLRGIYPTSTWQLSVG